MGSRREAEGVVAEPAGGDVPAGAADQHVVAAETEQPVVAEPAVKDVAGVVAGQRVGERVAGAVDRRGTLQRQPLDRRDSTCCGL